MILQKYVLKELLIHLGVILCIVTAIFLVFAYFHFIGEAANAKLNSTDITKILITEIPVLLQPILPLSFYLAILLVFRKLFAGNELVGMYASGMSEIKIIIPIMILCTCLCFFSAYMQLHIFPLANTKRIHLFEDSMHKITFDKVYPKQFNQLTAKNVIYIDQKNETARKLQGIFYNAEIPERNNKLAYDVIVAESIEERILPDQSRYIVFNNGTRYVSKLTSLELLIIQFEKFGVRLTMPRYRLENWPGCMLTKELYFLSRFDRYAAAELHWRISIPISIINLTFFLIAFNKGRIRGYLKPITTIYPLFVYLLYVNLLLVGVGLIKTEVLNRYLGLWLIHALMFIFCIFTFRYRPK